VVHVLIDQPAIAGRVAELARDIQRETPAGAPVHFVAVLKGAFVFLSDLVRAFDAPVTCDFLAVSSYAAGQTPSGEVRLTKDLDHGLNGRHVVLVEDIVDSGATLAYLRGMLCARGPASLRTVCLLDKPSRRRVAVPIEYVGFTIPDTFVVGYGLDLDERYRHLPYIGTLDGPGRA
jgi:hypoxanthine phosphoribosyltransferase